MNIGRIYPNYSAFEGEDLSTGKASLASKAIFSHWATSDHRGRQGYTSATAFNKKTKAFSRPMKIACQTFYLTLDGIIWFSELQKRRK